MSDRRGELDSRPGAAPDGLGQGVAGRRGLYFAFQGLLMAVLLLIFLYQYTGVEDWVGRLFFMTALLGGSMVFLRLASETTLTRWYFQAGLFLGDAGLAALILHWTKPASELYLIYFLIIFGTALTRSLAQSLVVALVTSGLFLVSVWRPEQGLPQDTGFWLRVYFLWVSAALLAILSRDSRQAQREAERKHQERLVQFERLATLGQLAGEVAHRIKGPLTTIMVNAEVLSRRVSRSPEAQVELAQIRDEVGHCRDILKSLLDLGRIEEMDRVRFDLREPLRRALESLDARLRRHGIRLDAAALGEPLPVQGDPSLMQEAIAAVLHNAADAVRDGGSIRVTARAASRRRGWLNPFPDSGLCELRVEDDGRGIAAADLERVFQPFFTTKGRYGSGLGLSAALRILQKHGGSIEAHSAGPGKGARFVLTVPRKAAARRLPALNRNARPRPEPMRGQ